MQQALPPDVYERLKRVVVATLNKRFDPNPFQMRLGIEFFLNQKKFIFCRSGRKSGKTEGIIYILHRFGMLNPGAQIYYVAPLLKQGKEIIWANRRLQNFVPRDWIKHEDRQELRLTLQNDSFIKVDGSDNFDAWAGITPDLVILDEFAAFRPEFYDVMNPNRAPKNAPLIIIGTPPRQLWLDKETPHQYVKLWNEAVKEEATGEAAALHFPSWANDKVPGLREWLEREKRRLEERGERDVWLREYGAELVESSAVHVFPQPDCWKKELKRPHGEVVEAMRSPDCDLITFCDPSSTNTFGVLFGGHNRFNGLFLVGGDIYEKRQAEMSTDSMWGKIKPRMEEISPIDRWLLGYDEAGAWFFNEMVARYSHDVDKLRGFVPSNKALRSKEDGISLLKDIFRLNQCIVSERADGFIWEVENYSINPKDGKPVKRHDHLIDCARYLLNHTCFTLNEEKRVLTGARYEDRAGSHPVFLSEDDDGDLPSIDDAFFSDIDEHL